MNTQQLAIEFVVNQQRKPAHASVELRYPLGSGNEYRLHGNVIAVRTSQGILFDWCGWYTGTTARHMNAILKAAGIGTRVSYSQARAEKAETFIVAV